MTIPPQNHLLKEATDDLQRPDYHYTQSNFLSRDVGKQKTASQQLQALACMGSLRSGPLILTTLRHQCPAVPLFT